MHFVLFSFLIANLSFGFEETEALRVLRAGCDKEKNALGCYNYANFLIKAEDSSGSDSYFEKGCKLGHGPSCKKGVWEIKTLSSSTQTQEFVARDEVMVKTETQVEEDGLNLKIVSTVSKKESIELKSNRQEFNKALEICQVAKLEMKHPLVRDFTIVETIFGIENDKCKYTQTMPNNGLMNCTFDETQRQALAQDQKKIQEYVANPEICEITGY